jgi:YD repeat-containing protein
MTKTEYIRDGQGRLIGTVTSGLPNGDILVRDVNGRILGHANTVFNITRDAAGRLISRNAADVGLLFR